MLAALGVQLDCACKNISWKRCNSPFTCYTSSEFFWWFANLVMSLVRVSLLTRTDMSPRLLFVCSLRPKHLAAGLAAGVLLGGVAAVPARAWPDIQALMQCSAKMLLLFLFQRSSTRRLTLSLRADHDLISFPLASLVKTNSFWPSKQLTWVACCCTTGCNAWIWCHVWMSQAKS